MIRSRWFLYFITASLAGFLFGFDTIAMSRAEEDSQRLWQLDGFWQGLCMSAALWGTPFPVSEKILKGLHAVSALN